jgi:hypothetical protein
MAHLVVFGSYPHSCASADVSNEQTGRQGDITSGSLPVEWHMDPLDEFDALGPPRVLSAAPQYTHELGFKGR